MLGLHLQMGLFNYRKHESNLLRLDSPSGRSYRPFNFSILSEFSLFSCSVKMLISLWTVNFGFFCFIHGFNGEKRKSLLIHQLDYFKAAVF